MVMFRDASVQVAIKFLLAYCKLPKAVIVAFSASRKKYETAIRGEGEDNLVTQY